MKKKQVKSKSPTPIKQHTAIETPRFKEKASQQSQMAQSPKIQIESEYFSFGGIQQHKNQSKSVHEYNNKEKKLNNSFTKEKKVSDSKPQKVQIFNIVEIVKNQLKRNPEWQSKYLEITAQQLKLNKVFFRNCNNYQIININQIEKKESIRSLQSQFQQILENQAPKKAATPVKSNPSNSPMKITTSKISAYPSANNYSDNLFVFFIQFIYSIQKYQINLLTQLYFQRIKKPGQSTLLRKKF